MLETEKQKKQLFEQMQTATDFQQRLNGNMLQKVELTILTAEAIILMMLHGIRETVKARHMMLEQKMPMVMDCMT